MRELAVIVHLDVPPEDDRPDNALAAEVADALRELGFLVAEAEPCPPMRLVPVVRDVRAD